jgi:hypothetical protein
MLPFLQGLQCLPFILKQKEPPGPLLPPPYRDG